MKRAASFLITAVLLAKSQVSWAPTHSNLAEGMCFFSSLSIEAVALDAMVDGKLTHRDGKPQHKDSTSDVYFLPAPIGDLRTYQIVQLNIEIAGLVYELKEPGTSGILTIDGERR